MGKRLTYEDVVKRVAEISDCELLETEYIDSYTPMRFRCRCGNEFQCTWNKFLCDNRRQCTKCAKEEQYRNRRLPLEDLKSRIASFGCEYVSGEYENQKSNVVIKCKCGHDRVIGVNSLYNTKFPFSGLCEECSRARRAKNSALSIEDVSEMAHSFGLELLSEKYISNSKPLLFRCRCGREFTASWNSVAQGHQRRCWNCSKKVSKGEYEVALWLDEHQVKYIPQKRFDACRGRKTYPFDFYLPDFNMCIEFDGQQHFRQEAFMGGPEEYESRKERDRVKDEYCRTQGIDIVRIPYTALKKIPTILSDKVIPR